MQHLIQVILENEAGALSRVIELFARRGYNIDSLSVSPSIDSDVSVLNIATTGDSSIVEQIIKQLGNIIPVISAIDITGSSDYVTREFMLARINAHTTASLTAIKDVITSFNGYIIRQRDNILVVQLVGDSKYFNTFTKKLEEYASAVYVNSGKVGISY